MTVRQRIFYAWKTLCFVVYQNRFVEEHTKYTSDSKVDCPNTWSDETFLSTVQLATSVVFHSMIIRDIKKQYPDINFAFWLLVR